MLSYVSKLWSSHKTPRLKRASRAAGLSFRPRLEGFEDRVVPAAPVSLAPALAAPAAVNPASLLPIHINSINFNTATGAITAVGTIGNQAFSTPLTFATSPNPAGSTPILNLHLGPINLDLLGLKVQTSEICLNITAQPGPGNLLGNLLGGIANSLNSGLPLGTVLGGLTSADLGTVTGGLTSVLNQGLGSLFSPAAVNGGSVTQAAGSTSILHLSLGPVDLNLLGLNVTLDNCHNGPVTVDITAQSGPGNLLGNLLTSVSHLLDGPANGNALTNALNRVAGAIGNILNGL